MYKGTNYDSKLSTKEIAAKVRAYIKANYKGWKVSVRKDSVMSISVTFLSADHDIFDHDAISQLIESSAKMAMFGYPYDCKHEKYKNMQADLDSGKGVDIQLSRYHDESDLQYLNPADRDTILDVISYTESFNYNNSDPYTDYFDVNFYSDYSIGNYCKRFQAVCQ